jgi:hypothetical protein
VTGFIGKTDSIIQYANTDVKLSAYIAHAYDDTISYFHLIPPPGA